MKQWYFMIEGEQQGPVDEKTLRAHRSDGQLDPGDLVWTVGLPGWEEFQNVAALNTDRPALADETPASVMAEFYDNPVPPPLIPGRDIPKEFSPHHGLRWLILGIACLCLWFVGVLPILVWYFSWRDLEAMELGLMDSSGRPATHMAFWIGGITTVVFLAFSLAAFLAYAIGGVNILSLF
jgi:hypothetical protein